jgi:hypothetical protein
MKDSTQEVCKGFSGRNEFHLHAPQVRTPENAPKLSLSQGIARALFSTLSSHSKRG